MSLPQLSDTTGACAAAYRSALARLAIESELDSTSRILQFGQIAETTSRSREISRAQPPPVGSFRGSALPPAWFTIFRQPLATVHAGRPNWVRYTARSAAACGSLNASTMATVWPLPFAADAAVSA